MKVDNNYEIKTAAAPVARKDRREMEREQAKRVERIRKDIDNSPTLQAITAKINFIERNMNAMVEQVNNMVVGWNALVEFFEQKKIITRVQLAALEKEMLEKMQQEMETQASAALVGATHSCDNCLWADRDHEEGFDEPTLFCPDWKPSPEPRCVVSMANLFNHSRALSSGELFIPNIPPEPRCVVSMANLFNHSRALSSGAYLYRANLRGANLGTTWIMLVQDLTDAISLADMIFHEWANKGIENAKERFGLYQQPGENRALIMLTPNISGGYCFVLERREIWWWNWSCPDPETVPVLWRQTKEGGDTDEA